MVGVPSKTGGCHTCRRRKVKCDLEKPHCLRCTRNGRVCEGYARNAVFLNRTQNGLQKRYRFEEILPRREITSSSPSSDFHDAKNLWIRRDSIPLPIPSSVMMLLRFQGLFMETYFPTDRNSKTSNGAWFYEALQIHDPGKALGYTLQAIFIARAGRMTNCQDLINHGRTIYGTALHELQMALLSGELSKSDETLAACYGCAQYEVSESTTNSLRGHVNHTSGIARLLEHRGKKVFDTPLGETLMEDIATVSMIRGLQHRTGSRIKKALPPSKSWGGRDKHKQKSCLIGFDLGMLIEDMDQAEKSPSTCDIGEVQGHLTDKFLAIDKDFDSWHQEYISTSLTPPFWISHQDSKGQEMLQFEELHKAHHMIDFWALQLALGTSILQFSNTMRSAAQSVDPLHEFQFRQLQQKHSPGNLMVQATNIMRSMPYCMRDKHGIASSQKCLFAGRAALYVLQHFGKGQYDSCMEIYLDLNRKKGLRYAQDMARATGNWKELRD